METLAAQAVVSQLDADAHWSLLRINYIEDKRNQSSSMKTECACRPPASLEALNIQGGWAERGERKPRAKWTRRSPLVSAVSWREVGCEPRGYFQPISTAAQQPSWLETCVTRKGHPLCWDLWWKSPFPVGPHQLPTGFPLTRKQEQKQNQVLQKGTTAVSKSLFAGSPWLWKKGILELFVYLLFLQPTSFFANGIQSNVEAQNHIKKYNH